MHYVQNTAEIGERSVLTLNSHCLLCCVRGMQCETDIYFINLKKKTESLYVFCPSVFMSVRVEIRLFLFLRHILL